MINQHTFLHRDYSREKVYTGVSQRDIHNLLKRSQINLDIYNRHVRGTYQYDEKTRIRLKKGVKAASWLIIDAEQAQTIVNQYGVKDARSKSTIFKLPNVIGIFVDQRTGQEIPTQYGKIVYSKTGAHITPLDPRKEN